MDGKMNSCRWKEPLDRCFRRCFLFVDSRLHQAQASYFRWDHLLYFDYAHDWQSGDKRGMTTTPSFYLVYIFLIFFGMCCVVFVILFWTIRVFFYSSSSFFISFRCPFYASDLNVKNRFRTLTMSLFLVQFSVVERWDAVRCLRLFKELFLRSNV